MAGLIRFDDALQRAQYQGFRIDRSSANYKGIVIYTYYAWNKKTAYFPKSGPGYKHLWRLLKRIDKIG